VIRVAAVDLGTNATRLLVADVHEGRADEVVRRTAVTRLGEGVDHGRRLLPEPIQRVRNVLADYRREAEELEAERALAVGTSAVRDADNGEAFLGEVAESYGFVTRLLSGDEEAQLTRRGVGAVDPETLVLDVGGGSTELILGTGHTSIDIGSVRLTERHLRSDPPTAAELRAAAAHVRSVLPTRTPKDAIGVSGTVAELQRLVGELSLEAVEAELRHLASLSVQDRGALPLIDPGRAPTIVAGTLVVAEVLRRYGLERLDYSVRDLLDGVALEAATLPRGV
jgi:exopolyphosphatase/guanosine-5'-triphosphate,3'-diphosphate pyrophosphatase